MDGRVCSETALLGYCRMSLLLCGRLTGCWLLLNGGYSCGWWRRRQNQSHSLQQVTLVAGSSFTPAFGNFYPSFQRHHASTNDVSNPRPKSHITMRQSSPDVTMRNLLPATQNTRPVCPPLRSSSARPVAASQTYDISGQHLSFEAYNSPWQSHHSFQTSIDRH